jgi:hypothetical protein
MKININGANVDEFADGMVIGSQDPELLGRFHLDQGLDHAVRTMIDDLKRGKHFSEKEVMAFAQYVQGEVRSDLPVQGMARTSFQSVVLPSNGCDVRGILSVRTSAYDQKAIEQVQYKRLSTIWGQKETLDITRSDVDSVVDLTRNLGQLTFEIDDSSIHIDKSVFNDHYVILGVGEQSYKNNPYFGIESDNVIYFGDGQLLKSLGDSRLDHLNKRHDEDYRVVISPQCKEQLTFKPKSLYALADKNKGYHFIEHLLQKDSFSQLGKSKKEGLYMVGDHFLVRFDQDGFYFQNQSGENVPGFVSIVKPIE